MVKKTRAKGKEDEKPTKGGGGKPVKVVTFDTPEPDPREERQHADDWGVDNGRAVSGSVPWGETAADDGGWNNPSSATTAAYSSPTTKPLPVPPPTAAPPPPASPQSPKLPAAAPDSPPPKVGEKVMFEETHDGYQTWDTRPDSATDREWGSPLSNATTQIPPVSPPTQMSALLNEPQSFAAAGAAMRDPNTQRYTSASEQARRYTRTAPPPHPSTQSPPAAPNPPAPPPHPAAGAPPTSTKTAQQWIAWTKKAPSSPPPASLPSVDRFGNRDDFAVVAAALDRDMKKVAAAAGHYTPKPPDWGPGVPSRTVGWSDPPKGSGMSQQGKRISGSVWPQPMGGDSWDTRSKKKGENSNWGNGSEAGWSPGGHSGHHRSQKHHPYGHSSKDHQPSKSWQSWGGRHVEESESETDEDDEWAEEDDWYEDPSKGGGGWGDQGGAGGWDSNMGNRGKGGWDHSLGKENSAWDTSGDGWGTAPSGWDHPQQNDSGWGTGTPRQGGWGGSKVITDPPENVGTRNVLSPQQHSQILNSLLNHPQEQKLSGLSSRYPHGVTLTDNPMPRKNHKPDSSWTQNDGWGYDPGWGPIQEEEEGDKGNIENGYPQSYVSQQKHEAWSNKIDDTSYSMPSKTMAYAYKGARTSLHSGKLRNSTHELSSVQFVESRGAALKPVEQALFGKARWAKDRIHWMFPASKDERVSQVLAWIESMSYQLAGFGLHKFLQSRERGALVVNAGFRMPEFPSQPVFDWLTFDQLQGTLDKIMQESVVFYDPATQVVVFILLPSKSGNSVAMWRRKIKVPNNTRVMYQQHITQALAGLKKETDYVVYVDRIPLKPEDPDKPKSPTTSKTNPMMPSKLSKASPATKKKKRKWWQIFK